MTIYLIDLTKNPNLLNELRQKLEKQLGIKRDEEGWRLSADGNWRENPASLEWEHTGKYYERRFELYTTLAEEGRLDEMDLILYSRRENAEPSTPLR